jgi:ribonuclease BN (tRNA processing enzyme)
MRLTVLGGCGGWPAAGLACSGYLVEHDGFRLLIDPGYAILPRLLTVADAAGSYPGEIAVASPGLVAEPAARGE